MLSQKSKTIIAFLLIYVVWGSTFFFVKIGLQSFTPFLFSTFRFLIGGTTLFLFSILRKEKFPSFSELPKYVLSGIVIFIGGVVAVVWAQQYITSSLAAAIITTPFWFIVLDRKQWNLYFSNKKIILGLFLGLIGVVILASQKSNTPKSASETMQLLGILVMIGGSFLWVAGSLYLKYKPSKSSAYTITAIQLLSAGAVCSIISFFNSEVSKFNFQEISFNAWLALLYLAIVSTSITYLAFMWLIKIKPPAIVSTYSYVNPLVATLLGWLFAHERISFIQISALAIILTGVLFVNLGKNLK